MLIKGLKNLTAKHRPSVVSIGNYDGVHLGHQHVVKTLLAKSAELNVPSIVITFEPLAKEFFMPNSVLRLTSVEQRAELLFDLGVDHVLCVDFTQDFANYSPHKFIKESLVNGLCVQHLCVGDDFRFGKNREGDFELLKRAGIESGFSVAAHETFTLDGERVSSGRVRNALASDDFNLAEQLLGRPYSIKGKISRGQQLGRTINFPTANIELDDYTMTVNGVFAVSCQLSSSDSSINGSTIYGVANVGKRPTVDGTQNRLEVHLFDFDRDIYGQTMDVQLITKVREEQKFDSVDDLRRQIALDVESTKKYLQKV